MLHLQLNSIGDWCPSCATDAGTAVNRSTAGASGKLCSAIIGNLVGLDLSVKVRLCFCGTLTLLITTLLL